MASATVAPRDQCGGILCRAVCCDFLRRRLDWAEQRCSRFCDAIKVAKVRAVTRWCQYQRRQALLV